MFFDDDELVLKKNARLRDLPPVPDTQWKPPQYFPNLSGATVIAFDTEQREKDWDHGPGWARGKSELIGYSVAARDARGNAGKWYFPIGHTVEPGWNIDATAAIGWLKETLETPHIPKVGANLIYDVGSLTSVGIHVQGELFDCQFAEALLDESEFVALDHLAMKYLQGGKVTQELYDWLAQAYGGKPNGSQRANLWRAPPRLVGPYGEADADLPLRILEKQWPLLEQEGLLSVFRMECASIPLLVRMRLQGVCVDIDKANQLYSQLTVDIEALGKQMHELTGLHVNVNSGRDLAKAFDACGIAYMRTADGNPSFEKEWLKTVEHPVGKLTIDIREHEKIKNTFVRAYLLESYKPINGSPGKGTIHCNFHPLKSEAGGTKTGRFSSDAPNLQNIPVRTKLGKQVRKAFVPFPGHLAWEKADYSQIEYRMLAHFATGKERHEIAAAEALRQTYIANPKTDYHDKVYGMVCPLMGWDFNDPDKELRANRRKPIKNINFGLVYGQSENSLSYKAGFTKRQAAEFFMAYHTAAPYVRSTMAAITDEVQAFGYVTTILGRRTRFNQWEPMDNRQRLPAMSYNAAVRHYGMGICRAYAYRGVNYKLQGSAAEVIKAAMVRAYTDGVFDVIGVPLLQVHDELDHSVIDDGPAQREGYAHLRHILENTTPCRIPIVADCGRGDNWGSID